jgi:NAD(P)-dependent dehydrogenase (short-subunit alcohol dehydrogenase family)
VTADEWASAIRSNVILPVQLLRECWHNHLPGASVCFLAGANPNKAPPNYSAYATGKMALLKAVEHMDAETPDAKMFCLAPGIVFTKIHDATMKSGIVNQGLEDRRKVGGTPIQKIYDCLKWCISQPKSAVGGRNICVSDPWENDWQNLGVSLEMESDLYKLRRVDKRREKE